MATRYDPDATFEVRTWDVEFRRTPTRQLMARIYQGPLETPPWAGALELVGRGVQHLEAAAHQLVVLGAEHGQCLLVAVDDLPLAAEHQADGGQIEGGAVIQ